MVIWVSPFCDGDRPARGARAGRKCKCGGSARSRVEAVFLLAGAKRRERAARPRAIHINEQRGETRMRIPQMTPPSVLSSYVRRDEDRTPLIQRAGETFRPSPISTAAIFSLGRVTGIALRRGRCRSCSDSSVSDGNVPTSSGGAVDALRPPQRSAPERADHGIAGAHESNPAGWLRKETAAGVCHSAWQGAPCSGWRPVRPEPASAVTAVQPTAGARHDGNPITADHHVICI